MTKRKSWRGWLLLAMLLWSGLAAAQALETLTLRHRSAEELIPQLRPLLAPGAALTGRSELLLIRTTPANLEEIRQVLAALDRPLRRLVISVRQAGQQSAQQGGIAMGMEYVDRNGRVVVGERVPAGVRREIRQGVTLQGEVVETRRSRSDSVGQQVQTVEGGRAYIQVGQSLPLALRQVVPTPQGLQVSDTVVYRDIGSGFYAEPRIAGDRVILDITTAQDTPGQTYGSAEVRRVGTSVSGRLGEWIAVGGSVQQSQRDGGGLGGSSAAVSSEDRQVWLKVEALD